MNSTLSAVTSLTNSNSLPVAASPTQQQIELFTNQLGQENSRVMGAISGTVEGLQKKLEATGLQMSSEVKKFDSRNDVFQLVKISHESTMSSVMLQMAGRCATSVTDMQKQLLTQQ